MPPARTVRRCLALSPTRTATSPIRPATSRSEPSLLSRLPMRLQSFRVPANQPGRVFSVRSQARNCIYNDGYCFRPPRPTGNPRAAAAVPHASEAEGVEGNVHASRAWKGNDKPRCNPASVGRPSLARLQTVLGFERTAFAELGGFSRCLSVSVAETKTEWLLTDKYGRNIHDLRISITDRCNYKCVYCRSGNDGPAFPEMPIADYLRMVRVFVGLGITKVRLTGGEPLLRRGLVEMVRELGQMKTLTGTSARHRHYHQWTPAGGVGAAAGRCRALSRDGVDGRGR